MKKTLCWLIVLAMLIAMAPSVFAAEAEGEVVTQVLLDTTATTADADEAFWGVSFELTSPGAGTITITFDIVDIYPEYQVNIADGWGEWINTAPVYEGASTMTYDVSTGDAILVSVATLDAAGEYAPGSVDFEVVFTGVIGAEPEQEEEVSTTLVEGVNPIVIESGSSLSPMYTFTPEQDGFLSLELLTLVSTYNGLVEDCTEMIADLLEGGNIGLQVDGYDYLEPVEVFAGTPVTITLSQSRMYYMYGYSWEGNLELTLGSDAEGGEEEPVEPSDGLVLGNNLMEAVSGNTSTYTFTATETGTLYVTVRNWAMNGIEYGERMLEFGWSELLINGTAIESLNESVAVTAGDMVTFEYSSDGDHYTSNVYLSMEEFFVEVPGSEFNPIELDPSELPAISVEIPAGEAVWYKLSDNFYDYELQVFGDDAYIVSYAYDYSASWPYPLVPTYHYAENGVATYEVAYTTIMIGNSGTEAATFEIDGYLPLGLSQNPDTLVMGEQTVEVAYEQYAYYIEWVAEEDGVLTLVFSGEMWRYNVQNVGDPDIWNDDGDDFYGRKLTEGDSDTAVVEVKAGDLVRIDVGCSDENWDLPAGSITITASFVAGGGEEDPELPTVENPIVIGDNVIELPLGATEASEYNFVATETGTLYISAVDFQYCASWTGGEYQDNNEYMTDWTDYTIFSVNGVALEGGFYGSVEVVAGEVYTFTWEHNEYSTYGYLATINLSYSDELMPVVGIDFQLRPSHLPMNTVEIGAGEMVLYKISYEFSGYMLTVTGENAYIYYEFTDWWSGESVTKRIDAVDGVVEYDLDMHGCVEIYIGNDGAEAATFELDYYAPVGGMNNPIIVDTLDEIEVTIPAQSEAYTYFQWTATEVGTVWVTPGMFYVNFENLTTGEYGDYDSTWENYGVYVETGDVLLIAVGGWLEEETFYDFPYEFEAGYRPGTEQNPIEVDLLAGIELNMYNETVYYVWTPEQSMVVTLDFTPEYNYNSNEPTVMVNGVAYTLGEELTVAAGESVNFSLSTTPSVYGTLVANVVEVIGEAEVIYEGSLDVETTDTYGYFDLYTLTAPVTGTYTFNVPAGLGVWSEESYMNWGAPEIDFYDNTEGYSFTKDLTEGEVFSFYVGAVTKDTWTITYTVTETAEGGDEGGEGGVPTDAVDLTIGNNSINAADITFVFTAPSDGTLILNLGTAIMGPVEGVVTVNYANAQTLSTMSQITLELTAGDVVLVAFTASGYGTMTAEWTGEVVECEHEFVDGFCIYCGEEDPNYNPDVEPVEPDGSATAPFIIEQLPAEFVQETTDDIYYKWTATENGTLYVYHVDGLVSISGSSVGSWDYVDGGKCIEVAAGDEIIINVWNSTGFSVEFEAEGADTVMVGDANGDGIINYLDAMLIAQYYVGDITAEDLNLDAADANGDGVINYLDAMLIAQYYVGDIDSLNP